MLLKTQKAELFEDGKGIDVEEDDHGDYDSNVHVVENEAESIEENTLTPIEWLISSSHEGRDALLNSHSSYLSLFLVGFSRWRGQ